MVRVPIFPDGTPKSDPTITCLCGSPRVCVARHVSASEAHELLQCKESLSLKTRGDTGHGMHDRIILR